MHELQELDGELDVTDAAAPALQLAIRQALARELSLGARLHDSYRPKVVGGELPVPERVPGAGGEGRSQLGVAGNGPRLDERLELPGVGPAVPVRPVGVERPDEWAVATFRPEVGVDAEAAAGDFHHRSGQRLVRRGLADEHDVDVAGVVELGPTQLAHADDRDALVGAGEPARLTQHLAGKVSELLAHSDQAVDAEQIARRDPQHLELLPSPEAVDVVGLQQRPVV